MLDPLVSPGFQKEASSVSLDVLAWIYGMLGIVASVDWRIAYSMDDLLCSYCQWRDSRIIKASALFDLWPVYQQQALHPRVYWLVGMAPSLFLSHAITAGNIYHELDNTHSSGRSKGQWDSAHVPDKLLGYLSPEGPQLEQVHADHQTFRIPKSYCLVAKEHTLREVARLEMIYWTTLVETLESYCKFSTTRTESIWDCTSFEHDLLKTPVALDLIPVHREHQVW